MQVCMQNSRYYRTILIKTGMIQHILLKIFKIKFNKNQFPGSRVLIRGQQTHSEANRNIFQLFDSTPRNFELNTR